MIKRSIALAVLFVACGTLARVTASTQTPARSETWLEDVVPMQVDGTTARSASDGSTRYTYKMDKSTYDELKPYGIVARVFEPKGASVDTVVIASNDKESFHDPRVCFTAQGYSIDQQETVQIPTSHGNVPATLAALKGKEDSLAVYLYKGPNRYVASTNDIKMDLFVEKLLHRRSPDGIFFRFIRLSPTMSKDDFLKFIGSYLDSAEKTSQGYL